MDQRFCPNCGSVKVEPDTRHTNVLGEIIADQNKWYCRECDYAGWMPAGEKEDDMEFEQVEQKPIDTDLGRAYTKYLLYVLIPSIVIATVYLCLG